MRVLGVVPSSDGMKFALLEGTRSDPVLQPIGKKTVKIEVAKNQGRELQDIYRLVKTLLNEERVEKVCILQASNSKFGRPSTARVKTEGVLQLVGADLSIRTELIAPQTLRAHEKKFPEQTKGTPESVLNNDKAFVPKQWRDAVLVAWVGLTQ